MKRYDNIDDCPFWNYKRAVMRNDSRYFYVLDDYTNLPEGLPNIDHIFEKFYLDKIDKIGLSDEERDMIIAEQNYLSLHFDYVMGIGKVPKHKVIQAFNKFNDKKKFYESGSGDMDTLICEIEKYRKIAIDEKNTTVAKFFVMVKDFREYVDRKRTEQVKKAIK